MARGGKPVPAHDLYRHGAVSPFRRRAGALLLRLPVNAAAGGGSTGRHTEIPWRTPGAAGGGHCGILLSGRSVPHSAPAAARRLPVPAWRCPDDRPEKKRRPAGLCAPIFQYTEGRAARAAPSGPHPVLPCGKKRFAGARRRAASAGCGRMCGACKGRRDCNPSADSRERRGA